MKLTLKQHKDRFDKYYILFISITATLIYLLTFAILSFTLSTDETSMITSIGIITVITVMYIDYLI